MAAKTNTERLIDVVLYAVDDRKEEMAHAFRIDAYVTVAMPLVHLAFDCDLIRTSAAPSEATTRENPNDTETTGTKRRA